MKKATNQEEVYAILEKYKNVHSPAALGIAFEKLYINSKGFSRSIKIAELEKLHPFFRTTAGNDWARSHTGYLGRKYILRRTPTGRSVATVKADGFEKNEYAKYIRSDIKKEIKKRKCAILFTSSNVECDHKDGMKDDWKVADTSLQQLDDFQPLSKAANMAKKDHCKRCKKDHERFDATVLGYSKPFIYGDKDSSVCTGCYWNDPIEFNKVISSNFIKEDEEQ